ncbi:zinc metalloproteinase nas-15-like [Dreissena polymorpha]|uniref:zinc metalloproteinase nas-15-like n=1 Tax=Dreissena polymorpha TaxID=45954 RepID=UPI002263D056|nr:zinc metalloproteinase nas-15-like [Dreissena polymorpha]
MDTHMRRTLTVLTIVLLEVQAVSTFRICKTCKHIQDPRDCRLFAECENKLCSVELIYSSGVYMYNFDCKSHHDCPASGTILVGKRATPGLHVCSGCCEGSGCENSLCSAYATTLPPRTTPVPTTDDLSTTTPTTTATTLPTTTDFNMYSGYTGHITGLSTIPSTTGGSCVDAEQFNCAELDRYNFSFSYAIAHEKCPRHCGFCTFGHVSSPTTTERPSTVAQPQANTVTGTSFTSAYHISATSGCMDTEDVDFSCSHWASLGFCSNQSSFFGHHVAIMRCPKACGFCTY